MGAGVETRGEAGWRRKGREGGEGILFIAVVGKVMDSYGGGHIGYLRRNHALPGVTAPAADFTRVGRGRRGGGGGGGGLHLLSEVGPIKLLSQSEEGGKVRLRLRLPLLS